MPDYIEIDPDLCDDDPTNRKSEDPRLLESIRVNGQLVPAILFAKGERYGIVEGHGRKKVVRLLGRKLKAIVGDEPGSEAERRRLRLNCNQIRKSMTREEQADDILAIKDEMKFATNKQLAEWIGIPESTLSSILKGSELDPSDAAKLDAAGCARSLKPIIARLATRDVQLRTIEYATTPNGDGKIPARDSVVVFAHRIAKGNDNPKKPKPVTFDVNGRRVIVYSKHKNEPAVHAAEAVKVVFDLLRKNPDTPAEGWPYLR